MGKLLMISGSILLLLGFALVSLDGTHVPFGHLPGDIEYRGKNVTFYFPLMSCLLLSALATAVLYLFHRFRH